MSQYTKSTNFATKDNLSPGDPLKVVRGTEIDTEFNNISTAIATKTDNSSAAITGGTISGITDLAIADGGTGASTAAAALNNLLPSQTSAANKYLQSDGTNASWDAVSLSTADITGTLAVANGGTGVTSSTGTGSVVLSNSPTLVTPALGTPSALVGTNITGTASGLTAGSVTTNANLTGAVTSVGNATSLGSFTSSQLATALTDETGSGSAVFATSPTLVTPALGTPSALVGTNITGTAANFNINGTVGATTANTGNFTTLTTSSTVTLNGGTANGVTYLDGSKVLTSGSALSFNGSSATPILTITKGTSTTLSGLNFVFGSATSSILVNDGSGEMQFAAGTNSSGYYQTFLTDSVERMRLTTTGLGIGTSSPSFKLDVVGTNPANQLGGQIAVNTSTAYSTGNVAGISFRANDSSAGLSTYATIQMITTGDNAGALTFVTRNGAGAYDERMRINAAGNLGIGVTPSAWGSGTSVIDLNTGGSAGAVSSSGTLSIANNGYFNGTNWIYKNSSTALTYQLISGQHRWNIAASGTAGNAISFTQAMTLDASGNLLVTTTSAQGGKLQVAASYIRSSDGQSSQGVGYVASDNAGNEWHFGRSTSNGYFYVVRQTGTGMYMDTNSWVATSDIRAKENIVSLENSLSKVIALNPVRFKFKSDGMEDVGFIAQEMYEHIPDAVHKPENEEEMMGISKEKIIPFLVKAIQEQQAIIESLKARLDAANL